MDWTQTITLGGTLIAYMTGMCLFFHRLNERNIDRIESRFEERMDKSEAHWREMFMYMNGRIDGLKKHNHRPHEKHGK